MNPLFRCQGKDTELVEDVLSVGDDGKEPVKVFLVYSLWEESDNAEEVTSLGTEFDERRRSKGEFYGCSKALVMICPKYPRLMCVPLLGQSIVIPRVVRRSGSERRYRENAGVQALQEVVDDARPAPTTIDSIKDVTCRLHRQCRDFRTYAVPGDRCDPGSDTRAYRSEPAQFIHDGVDLLGVCAVGVENGFSTPAPMTLERK